MSYIAQEISEIDIRGKTAYESGNYTEALRCLLRMRELGITGEGWESNMLQCLVILGKMSDALPFAENLAKKSPQRLEYLFYYSICLSALGRFRESYDVLSGVPLEIRGMLSQRARFLLREGDVEEALRLIREDEKFVPLEKMYTRQNLPFEKRYRKGMPLAQKTVCIFNQGGLGDSVATVRYARVLHERGARVIIVVPKILHPLFKTVSWPLECREADSVHSEEFDYYISNGSADLMLELDFFDPSLAAPFPYLKSNPVYLERWRDSIEHHAQGRLKIAVHWQGKKDVPGVPQLRDVPYEVIRRFGSLGALFSFQRGEGLLSLSPDDGIYDLGSRFSSLEDTAAALDQMDYVVTGDAFLAHLAGALNKKTALLLHLDHFVLWIRGGRTSLWYPSVRMFKQKSFGEWDTPGKEAFEWVFRDQHETS